MEQSSNPNFKRAAIEGVAWRYISYASGKLLIFISTVVLARLLSKDDFGVVGYAVTVIAFLDIVSDLGVSPAVIYFPEDERTYSTAFWLGLIFGTSLFVITWMIAPWIGVYFKDDRAVNVTRMLSFTYPIAAVGGIHATVLRKKLAFGKTFLPDFLQSAAKGLSSIAFAWLGFGAISLIWGQLLGTTIGTIGLWVITPWKPTRTFDTKIAKDLLSYGIKFVGVDFIGILLLNLDYLLVGRYMGAAALGVYSFAFRLPDLLILQFVRVLSTVLFPIYSKMKDVGGSLSRGFAQTTRYISLLTVPLGLGIALVAHPFVITVFSSKWEEAIPVIRAIAIYAMFLSFAYNAGSAYKAQGRPQVLTWLSLARLVMLFPALYWAVTYARSIVAVGWMHALVAFLGGMLNLLVAARLLGLSIRDLIEALRPSFLAGALMTAAVLPVLYLTTGMPDWAQLILSTLVGAAAYGLGIWFLQRDMVVKYSHKIYSTLLNRG